MEQRPIEVAGGGGLLLLEHEPRPPQVEQQVHAGVVVPQQVLVDVVGLQVDHVVVPISDCGGQRHSSQAWVAVEQWRGLLS